MTFEKSNQGNNLAEYKFVQGQYFTTIPTSATVEPNSAQEVVITFKPGPGTIFEETLAVEVAGGTPLQVDLSKSPLAMTLFS